MENPKQMANRVDKIWKNMSKTKRLGVAGLCSAFLIALVAYYIFFGQVNYVPIFPNLEMNDSADIIKKLDEMKISDYRIEDEGMTILVPESQVGRLRIDLAMDGLLPKSSKGFEIFDDTGFAVTDEDRKIMYQRALEGELARSVMSLEEVEYARVHLALSEESVFTREAKPGSATVVLKINSLNRLEPQHIRGIIALVSGAVRNVPEGNVRVIDTNANLLSEGIFMDESEMSATALVNSHLAMEAAFESDLEVGIQNMLEQTLGVGNVLVKINADMDFDSEETTIVEYDDEKVLRSQQDRLERSDSLNATAGSSPVDNNLEYYIENPDAVAEDGNVSNFETTRNYEIGETRMHRIKAPGEVRRISTSVVYNGTLSQDKGTAIRNLIVAAVGYDESRGDLISVEGMAFDKTYQNQLIAEMEVQQATTFEIEQKRQKYLLYGGIAGGFLFLILLAVMVLILRKGQKGTRFRERLDMNIGQPLPLENVMDNVIEEATVRMESMEDGELEKSVKMYADEHPEKLAELVKTWVLKDEV
ncbi:MAG: flagellar M-ring protein FliF [Peptostreptococcaceae bacterium]|nr:flagellar M-ring protein FliF [Peptostreptococcaceae bacterium]